ncbi:hypothetical protein [Ferruginibacter sp.]
MKKLIIVLAAGMIASNGMAQTGQKVPPPPPPAPPKTAKFAPPKIVKDELPAPPPPPAPPKGAKFTPPKIVKDGPPPPPPPPKNRPAFMSNKGYAMKIVQIMNEPVIILTKKGTTQKIRMSVWNAKPAYFESKYGQLPPPPPPPPAPPKE